MTGPSRSQRGWNQAKQADHLRETCRGGGGARLNGKLQPHIISAHHCEITNQVNVNFQLAAQIN